MYAKTYPCGVTVFVGYLMAGFDQGVGSPIDRSEYRTDEQIADDYHEKWCSCESEELIFAKEWQE